MRRRLIPIGLNLLLATLMVSSVAAHSSNALPGVSTVPLCADVPDIDLSAAPFRNTPVYVGDGQPVEELRTWARQQPGFEELWIDRNHFGWVVLAFSHDAQSRQADIDRQFPGVGAVAVDVDWTLRYLEDLQRRAIALGDFVQMAGIDVVKGVVFIDVGLLEPERIAQVERHFSGEPVCIDGIDPSTQPSPGPQPLSGDGWRLLGDAVVGEPYRTGIAADQTSYRSLWVEARTPGLPPAVDFETEVAIWFGAVFGGSCPHLRLDDVVVDTDAALIHSQIVSLDAAMMCTDDAIGHAYVVALARTRLPASPFRIQLEAADPPAGATDEITEVDADLRVPGSVPSQGQVHGVVSQAEPRLLHSGDVMETGFSEGYLLDVRCGAEWLGQLNGIWWRTEPPAGRDAWVPDAWQTSVDAAGMLPVSVILREATDPAMTDGQPRADATANQATVIYHATTEPRPGCP